MIIFRWVWGFVATMVVYVSIRFANWLERREVR